MSDIAGQKKPKGISSRPTRLRIAAPRGIENGTVEREGGDNGAGLIQGISVNTIGEADGHNIFLDSHFVNQVVELGNSKPGGVKSHFTHPGLSGDGLGSLLGKFKNFRRGGDKAIADLHLHKSAHDTPNGNLAKHVMDLAEESPEDFGASIMFSQDEEAQNRFIKTNRGENGAFESPDKQNSTNLIHARIAKLNATDFVDDPAANPDGLFAVGFAEGGEMAARAEGLLEFALGLSDTAPNALDGGPDADRAKIFFNGFLERHGLQVLPKESAGRSEVESEDAELSRIEVEKLGRRVKTLESGFQIITRKVGLK